MLVFIIVTADFFNVSLPLCSLIVTNSTPYFPVKNLSPSNALGVNKFSLYFIDIKLPKISKATGNDFCPKNMSAYVRNVSTFDLTGQMMYLLVISFYLPFSDSRKKHSKKYTNLAICDP